jgi:hypothetical protein
LRVTQNVVGALLGVRGCDEQQQDDESAGHDLLSVLVCLACIMSLMRVGMTTVWLQSLQHRPLLTGSALLPHSHHFTKGMGLLQIEQSSGFLVTALLQIQMAGGDGKKLALAIGAQVFWLRSDRPALFFRFFKAVGDILKTWETRRDFRVGEQTICRSRCGRLG